MIKAAYGFWESDLAINDAVDRSATPGYPFKVNGDLYWYELITQEKGRGAIVRQTRGDPETKEIITPSDFNIRTRVNEYGGKCFVVFDHWLIFNHYVDHSLYCQNLQSDSEPWLFFDANSIPGCCGFADLTVSAEPGVLVAVAEKKSGSAENQNFLIAISLNFLEGRFEPETLYSVLADRADFYSNPVIDHRGEHIAWIEWSHPFMPWDQNRLILAELEYKNGKMGIGSAETVVDAPSCSVFQPGFLADGSLLFVSDRLQCDYWNFFHYKQGTINRVTYHDVEYGEAQWIFGQSRWVSINDQIIVAIATGPVGDEVVSIDIYTGAVRHRTKKTAQYSHIALMQGDELLWVSHFSDRAAEITCITEDQLNSPTIFGENKYKKRKCSEPVQITYPTGSGQFAHAFFYAPFNTRYVPMDQSLPPLVVMVHGGPTSRTNGEYNGLKQYFCSLGYAVLDINHRGSTGYGRKFRQALLGQWGMMDVEDIARGIGYVIDQGWIDPELVFIRGSSAGGYAVMRALTCYPEIFCGGACYYGIGNLITLSELTHKFESHYTDRLIGEVFDSVLSRNPQSEFVKRSPVFDVEKVVSPLIIFQGSDDKVVPPALALEIVEGLEKRKILHQYIEYSGEGHGFRIQENRIDSLVKETGFFRKIIKQRL